MKTKPTTNKEVVLREKALAFLVLAKLIEDDMASELCKIKQLYWKEESWSGIDGYIDSYLYKVVTPNIFKANEPLQVNYVTVTVLDFRQVWPLGGKKTFGPSLRIRKVFAYKDDKAAIAAFNR